jgi:hypothetical protein
MGYAALGLSIVGFVTGLVSPFKVLLLLILLLLFVSTGFAVANGLSLLRAALVVVAAQTIFQTSYFLGAVARYVLTQNRMRPVL